MKVDLNQKLLDFEGDPIKIAENDEVWTLKKAVVNSLGAALDADKGQDYEKAIKRWKLAVRLQEGGEQEIEAEELVEIRKRLVTCYPSALISGQACEMLKG